ncbi:lysine transporter LysE [Trinickia dabaoshanensis]|uniref:Lysine transporter LysE n=1 Tax=Trinickia dabaoshanensis TaxID=564714 RepID=A0A2N7VN87_9BURK|nr:LysE family transporter [Trinickia dabaoshanensis]PMS18619.1 lysine transporter LysE [Trinickia dabaoshanensis]
MLFLKSMTIGLSIAAPVGPIGMLCIQRSLSRGFRYGFATGLGAACADAIYGLLGALGIAGIATALPGLSTVLKIAGGAFLLWLAFSIAREKPVAQDADAAVPRASTARAFLTTFGLTLSNPMTIIAFIGIFAALGPMATPSGAAGGSRWLTVGPMVAGVFAGSAAWWLCLSGASAALGKKMPTSFMHGIARASALVIGVFGAVQLIAGVRYLI